MSKVRPDIRAITRLVPPSGNLVQGQSELAIAPNLAAAASRLIAESQNHYSPAEGTAELRRAIAEKIAALNGIKVDPEARPFELLVTPGGTGALISIAHTYLRGAAALVFEPYYPYHRRILEELDGVTEVLNLRGPNLEFDPAELRRRCTELKARSKYPLKAIIVCTPANPTGKVFSQAELEHIASVCRDLDLLCISDEVYEHYTVGGRKHLSIASFPGMWERTLSVNSFSKSWNISGWRLGYMYGPGKLVGPANNSNNVFYVCSATPLQKGLAEVLTRDLNYYGKLHELFTAKRKRAGEVLEGLGFELYDSGSAFYIWARIPREYNDALSFNEMLLKNGVAGVPGSAFADSDDWDSYMRFCIAREESVLDSSLEKLTAAMRKHVAAS